MKLFANQKYHRTLDFTPIQQHTAKVYGEFLKKTDDIVARHHREIKKAQDKLDD